MSKRKERRMSQNDHAEGNDALVQTQTDATTSTAIAVDDPVDVENTPIGDFKEIPVNPESIDEFPDGDVKNLTEGVIPDEPLPASAEVAVSEAKTTSEVSDAMKQIAELTAKIESLQGKRASKRVASGSKPRPNVKYTLLQRPPKWNGAPQVDQLMNIMFSPLVTELAEKDDSGNPVFTEPELFKLIEDGAASGYLRTKQNPVRIFQYYRATLIKENVLRQQ